MACPVLAADIISWTYIGHPASARDVGLSFDGKLYALNMDKTLWVNEQRGADGRWSRIAELPADAEDLMVAAGRVYFQKRDRSLWHIEGGRLVRIGTPFGAMEIAGTESAGVATAILYALNDDKTLWVNTSGGVDHRWIRKGQPRSAKKIAASRGAVFALNTDGSIWINQNQGTDGNWQSIGRAPHAMEIAAANEPGSTRIRLYALNTDFSLWTATVTPPPSSGIAHLLIGKTDCSYADPACNRCVNNVIAEFNVLPLQPTSNIRYTSRGGSRLPPRNAVLPEFAAWESHVQSIARIPGLLGENWFVLSRSRPGNNGSAGFFLVELGDFDGHGGQPLARSSSDPAPNRITRYYYPISGTDHPGGLQMIGKVMAITASCDTGEACGRRVFVDFYDLVNPGDARNIGHLELNGAQREPNQPSHATSVAVAKLRNGHYLLFVHGKDNRYEGWFYLSGGDRTTLSSNWQFFRYWQATGEGIVPAGAFNGKYQNTAMLTECGTGNPEFMGPLDEGHAIMDLFRIEVVGDMLRLRRVGHRIMDSGDGGYCSFRAGAMPHVTPSGGLALYCTAHKANTNIFGNADSKLKMSEFAR